MHTMENPLSFEATPWAQGNSWVATIKPSVAEHLDHKKIYEFTIKELESLNEIGKFEGSPRTFNRSSIVTIDRKLVSLMDTSKKYMFLIPSILIEIKYIERK